MISQQLVSLCLKIMNSVVLVGFYYGFLATLSIGPSYLFLIRARVMEEETEKLVSATTGFITGQLMMFISIYYAPLHLALSRPHTITFLTLPYLFFNFLDKNDKHYYLDSGYKYTNSMRKFSIHKVFFNNLLFQLLNPLLFPSSILIRLVNIYLFRCNNKLLFLTSSFVGWLIGHIFLMKLIGFILVWLQQNNSINSIKSKVTIRFDKYILFKLRNYVGQIFVLFSLITFLHYLGRIPVLYFLNDDLINYFSSYFDEIEEFDGERDSEKEEDLSHYLFDDDTFNKSKTEEPDPYQLPIVKTLFDFDRWIRPLRYIKNDHFDNAVRDENSQFFFQICQSDGKERISFTYPPDLSTFLKMMEKKIDPFTRDKISYNELSNYWSSTNKEKRKKLSNEFYKRAKVLDKQFLPMDVLENRIRLCNDKKKRKYLTQIYDPFLNGKGRGQMLNSWSLPFENEMLKRNSILINKIHGLLLSINSNYPDPEFELEQKINPFDRKSLLNEIGFFFNLISKFSEKSVSSFNFDKLYLFPEHEQVKIYSEEKKRKKKFLVDTVETELNHNEVHEISKEVPRWSYSLIDEMEETEEGVEQSKEPQIRSRYGQPIVIFTTKTDNFLQGPSNTDDDEDKDLNNMDELSILHYSHEPDFDREIIKGSMRPLRRKTVPWKFFQKRPNSPLFLEQTQQFFLVDLFEDISRFVKEYFRKKGTDNSESEFLALEKGEDYKEEEKYDDENRLREIEEAWESILYGLIIRSFVIIFQSIIRKYIILPSLIITKNIIRILLFQSPEWSEDYRDWQKEVHIKCTYQGVPVSHKGLPENWFTEGLQIRILSPFVLKPWHKRSTAKKKRSTAKKKRSTAKKNVQKETFWYLTACGTLVESYLDYYFPNPFSILAPIFQKIQKQLKKNFKNRFFLVLQVLNERKKWFVTILKEIEKWNIKSILFRFKNISELGENNKNSTISKNNPIIYESPVLINSMNWTNSSFTEKRIKDLNVKTKTIITEIEKMTNEGGVLTSEKNLNSNKTTYDAKRFELQKNILKILQRRIVRLTRKSYSFFKFFMERVYIDILLCIIGIPRINIQLFLESTKKIVVTKSISNKKTNAERIDKTHQSIIPFMSIIHKSCNITNTNSENSCDVSSLSQAYVFFKLSQIQVIKGYKYKLRSIFESHERSFFLKNEIKNYFFRIQGIFNSKLRHKNRPHSVMNQWTNWLKVHYQYDLPESRWSRLGPQNWRNRINKHRVAQNKDLMNYDSYDKTRLILYKNENEQVDLLNFQKKIKKQYRYDLLSYKYLNYADKKNSYIYGYRSPFQTNKNQTISYNDNTCKKEFFDITGDISIKNYLAEDAIIDMLDRKYFDWMVMNVEIPNRSISNPKSNPKSKFWFFSKLSIFYDAYKKNPWIVPIKSLSFPFYVKNVSKMKKYLDWDFDLGFNILKEEKDAGPLGRHLSHLNQTYEDSYWENGSNSIDYIDVDRDKYGNDIQGELDFLVDKYMGFHLNLDNLLDESIMDQIQFYCILIRLKNIKKLFIKSIKKGEISLDMMAIDYTDLPPESEYMDPKEINEKQIFSLEPVRLARKNYEQFFMYQTISLSLIHKNKRQIFQRNPEKGRKKNLDKNITRTRNQKITENKDKNHTDLLVPENLLSNRRRRELRILICLNPRNTRNTINCNENKINTGCQVLAQNKDLDIETKKLMNLKFFLWPNYRLEDLACINRYWFDTQNGSRFSILRIHMYPRLKI
nr:hypothetical chloroplast RF19 [Astragalus iranicus]